MTTRAEVVAEARTWVGTRWRHQLAVKGIGCDCVGLVRGVAMGMGIYPADALSWPEVQQFAGYGRLPANGMLTKGCGLFANKIPLSAMQPGDIVLMRFEDEPQHVGILGNYPYGGLSLIHAYMPGRSVVEARIDEQWRRRIVAAYSLPGIDA